MNLTIKQGSIDEIVALSAAIPEFNNPYTAEEYRKRLSGSTHLILVAVVNGSNAGFKVGYDRYSDGSFYSWMGGLLPQHRGKGIYQQLTFAMERWAAENGYSTILLKTRNRLLPMIRFCLSAGYHVSGFSEHPNPMESRIYFRKELKIDEDAHLSQPEQTGD